MPIFWMARAEWCFQQLRTSVTSCSWKRSCLVSPNWNPGGPVRTTPLGGRSLWWGGGAPGPLSGPTATFSNSRGGGSFLGTRPPWEESSVRSSNPDQSPNFGMSPEFSQGSTRPSIFDQGSDSFWPSESYSSGRPQHPPGFLVTPEGGSAKNIALDCKFQELIRAFHSVQREVQAKREKDQACYQRWSAWGHMLSPMLVRLVVHHWSGSGLGLRNLSGLRLLSQADALRRPRLQGSIMTFRWQGFGALGGSIFPPPGEASGTFCWELPTDNGCASPGTVPTRAFRVSGIWSLVPWPGSGAQGSKASGWGTDLGVPCPSCAWWGSTTWAAPHCRFAASACARACGFTAQVAQATKKEEEVSCGEGWWACRQGVLALPSAGALQGRLPPASLWAHGDCPWGCLGGGDPNGGVSRSQ